MVGATGADLIREARKRAGDTPVQLADLVAVDDSTANRPRP